MIKEVNEAGEKFIENIIPYLDEYQNTVGGGNELLLKVNRAQNTISVFLIMIWTDYIWMST